MEVIGAVVNVAVGMVGFVVESVGDNCKEVLPLPVVGAGFLQPASSMATSKHKSINRFMAYHPFRICHIL
jgi:hypothetical protein